MFAVMLLSLPLLCGCGAMIETSPDPFGPLSGQWNGTIEVDTGNPSYAGMTYAIVLTLVERSSGPVIGSVIWISSTTLGEARHVVAVSGATSGDALVLYVGQVGAVQVGGESMGVLGPLELTGTVSGDVLSGSFVSSDTITISGSTTSGTWQVTRFE